MRPVLRFAAAFVALEALSAAGQDLNVIAELPGAIADSSLPRAFVLSLAKGGPKFVVNVATPSRSIRVWPVGRVSEPIISDLPEDAGINAIAAFADFDGDGFLDAAITGTNQIVFLKGDGAGHFALAATLATSFQPYWLAAGDFDGDGRTDLVAVQSNQNPSAVLSCFLSTGAFAFAPPRTTIVTTFDGVLSMTAGDLDADGRADLVLAPGMGSVSVWRGAGDGTFTLLSPTLDSYHTESLILADLDGDGLPEILFRSEYRLPFFPFSIYKNDGGGRFHLLATLGGNADPFLFDVDGDGPPEIVIQGQRSLSIWKLAGSAFTEATLTLPTTHMMLFGAVDWDGDGVPAFVSAGADRIQVFGRSGVRTDVVVVPVLLSTAGLLGSRFDSDLLVTNSGTTPAHATLHYTASTGGGTGTVETDLAPGRQLFAPSAVGFLRDAGLPIAAGGNVIGTLRIEVTGASSPGAVSTSVRTTTPAGAGVAHGGSPLVALLRGPSILPWLIETAKDRTNLGLVNAGAATDGPVTLRVEVHSADGASSPVVLPDVVLQPGAFSQVGRVLATTNLATQLGWARITRVGGNAPFLAWAAVNDAVSGDGSFVPAVPESAAFETDWVVPSAVQNARYATEFVATNPGYSPVNLRVTLVATGTVLQETLGPGATFYVRDFFAELRRRGLPGAPAAGSGVVSPLFLRASGFPQVFAGIRVSTGVAGGASYGVFEPATPQDPFDAFSAVVPDLRQDTRTRTNVGILNLVSGPMKFRIDIFDGTTGSLVASRDDLVLAAFEQRQLNSVLKDLAPGTTRGWARVTPLAPYSPVRFAAYAVVNDGAQPGQGTGDGSFVPGIPE
ncbi:MAG: FG-GAP repeat domain-containing protein [Acidobacteriota bacterium]